MAELTKRQLEFVALGALGKRTEEIAAELGVSLRAVPGMFNDIRLRLGCRTVQQMWYILGREVSRTLASGTLPVIK